MKHMPIQALGSQLLQENALGNDSSSLLLESHTESKCQSVHEETDNSFKNSFQ